MESLAQDHFCSPRDQTTLQDAADKHEVLLKAQLARDKSESAGSQSHHCARRKHKSPSNYGANGKTIAEDKQTGVSTEDHDTTFFDVKNGYAVDCPNENGPRCIRAKTIARIGHRSMEVGPHPVRDMGGDDKINENVDEGCGSKSRVLHSGPTLACGAGEAPPVLQDSRE